MIRQRGGGIKNLLAQQWGEEECISFLHRSAEERDDEVGVGMGRHQARNQFSGGRIASELSGIRHDSVCQAVLIVDRYDWQIELVANMAGQWFEVGNDQVDAPFFGQVFEIGKTARCPWNRDEILGDRPPVANAIVDVGKAKSVNLDDIELVAEVAQPAVESGYVERMSARGKMGQDFFGASRVTGAFAIHSVQDVSHERKREYIVTWIGLSLELTRHLYR